MGQIEVFDILTEFKQMTSIKIELWEIELFDYLTVVQTTPWH